MLVPVTEFKQMSITACHVWREHAFRYSSFLKMDWILKSLFSLFCKSCVTLKMQTFHIYLEDVQVTNIWKCSPWVSVQPWPTALEDEGPISLSAVSCGWTESCCELCCSLCLFGLQQHSTLCSVSCHSTTMVPEGSFMICILLLYHEGLEKKWRS